MWPISQDFLSTSKIIRRTCHLQFGRTALHSTSTQVQEIMSGPFRAQIALQLLIWSCKTTTHYTLWSPLHKQVLSTSFSLNTLCIGHSLTSLYRFRSSNSNPVHEHLIKALSLSSSLVSIVLEVLFEILSISLPCIAHWFSQFNKT